MITVYGADWCEDTQRSLRHLRRLSVPHQYINIDEDLDALDRAKSLAEVMNAELVTIPGGGHNPLGRIPAKTNTLIVDFLDREGLR